MSFPITNIVVVLSLFFFFLSSGVSLLPSPHRHVLCVHEMFPTLLWCFSAPVPVTHVYMFLCLMLQCPCNTCVVSICFFASCFNVLPHYKYSCCPISFFLFSFKWCKPPPFSSQTCVVCPWNVSHIALMLQCTSPCNTCLYVSLPHASMSL